MLKNIEISSFCTPLSTESSFFKAPAGALIPRSFKNYKKIQNFTKHYKSIQNTKEYSNKEFLPPTSLFIKTVKEALAVCRSFLDGVVIFYMHARLQFECSVHVFVDSFSRIIILFAQFYILSLSPTSTPIYRIKLYFTFSPERGVENVQNHIFIHSGSREMRYKTFSYYFQRPCNLAPELVKKIFH